MRRVENLCYSPETEQYLDIYLPESTAFPVFVYFHGGGLESGDKQDQAELFRYLTDRGVGVVSANYRMYPRAHYPEFILDAAAAVAWVHNHLPAYGTVTALYVGGSSAGGYLSQMLCFDPSWLGRHGLSPLDIDGFVLDAGQPTCHYNVLRERGEDTRRVIVDEAAPLFHINDTVTYPPMLIIVSDNDMENRYEQTMLLLSTLRHFRKDEGVTLKTMHGTHCAYVDRVEADGTHALGILVWEFLKQNGAV